MFDKWLDINFFKPGFRFEDEFLLVITEEEKLSIVVYSNEEFYEECDRKVDISYWMPIPSLPE